MGSAGRQRMENCFSVRKTIEPLEEQFRSRLATSPSESDPSTKPETAAYLLDCWPDRNLPFLVDEFRTLQRNAVPYTVFVFEPPVESDFRAKVSDFMLSFEYLPDPMVIEAEWQSNLGLVHELESIWANQRHRAPPAIFLTQARAALILRRLFKARNIGHVHSTSSRTLLTGYFLKRLLGLTWSAAVEARPILSEAVIRETLEHSVGGLARGVSRSSLQQWSKQLLGLTRGHE